MKSRSLGFPLPTRWGSWISLAGAVLLSVSTGHTADIPAPATGSFSGIYKVEESTDPMFPVTRNDEYFLDFGRGIQADRLSGSVTISLRRNPDVKASVMVWQYFPAHGKIVIGNRYAPGSHKAVAMGAWTLTGASDGVIFVRGIYRMFLRHVDPADY